MNTDKNLEIETHATTEEALAEIIPEKELTGNILRGAFAVHNVLGAGFLERVYSNALAVELAAPAIDVRTESTIAGDISGRA